MTRPLLASLVVVLLSACPSTPGPQGEPGAPGTAGPAGPQGATGPQGPAGPPGPQGEVLIVDGGVVTGPAGPRGASVVVTPISGGTLCPAGGVLVSLEDGGAPQAVCNGVAGRQGPAGADGATGANGLSVVVTPLDAGTACATGGVRLTSGDGGTTVVCHGVAGTSVTATTLAVGDANCPTGGSRFAVGSTITYACNGAAGPQGPVGPAGATGAAGAPGPQGPAGPTGATGPQGPAGATGPQGPIGLTGATGATGAAGPAGPAGAAGPAGPAGATGPMGPMGPPGAPGPAVTLDGGVLPERAAKGITFAGYTASLYNGNLGGPVGANAKCHAEFSGSHLCTYRELSWAAPPGGPGAAGAWADDEAVSSQYNPNLYPRDRGFSACINWTRSTNPANEYNSFHYLLPTGLQSSDAYDVCGVPRQLACCRAPTSWFRGFTATLYTGNLGGPFGANAKCHAEYPGSHLCTQREFTWSGSPVGPGAAGAWIDEDAVSSQYNPNLFPRDRGFSACINWTRSTNPPNEYNSFNYLLSTGLMSNDAYDVCGVARQLACCSD